MRTSLGRGCGTQLSPATRTSAGSPKELWMALRMKTSLRVRIETNRPAAQYGGWMQALAEHRLDVLRVVNPAISRGARTTSSCRHPHGSHVPNVPGVVLG